MSGKENTSVFPEPVKAIPTISRPDRATGSPCTYRKNNGCSFSPDYANPRLRNLCPEQVRRTDEAKVQTQLGRQWQRSTQKQRREAGALNRRSFMGELQYGASKELSYTDRRGVVGVAATPGLGSGA